MASWTNLAVLAVVAVLVLAWVRPRSKPHGPDGGQRDEGFACGYCTAPRIWTDFVS
jgi:hypothetical protein